LELLRSAWPHIRAWLVAVHVFAVVAMALPAPGGGMNRSAWKDPTVQDEFEAWRGRLAAMGVETTPEEFEERLWTVAKTFMDGRTALLAPFQPYYRNCGTLQSWRMFVAPHMYPARMWIEVQEDGVWRPVYVDRSREYDWLSWRLGQDRFRSAIFRFSWKPYRKMLLEFADWVAIEAHRDFPDATKVRVRFWKARSPTPEEALSGRMPEGTWVFPVVRKLPPEPK
jgi:hypothetical protein